MERGTQPHGSGLVHKLRFKHRAETVFAQQLAKFCEGAFLVLGAVIVNVPLKIIAAKILEFFIE